MSDVIRLSDRMREKIAGNLIGDRFADRIEELVRDYARLADAVYTEKYGAATRQRMSELKSGWLRENTTISAKFSEAGEDYTSLDFSGCDGYIRKVLHSKESVPRVFENIPRRFLDEDFRAPVLVERESSKKLWDSIKRKKREIKDEHEKLYNEIMGVLLSVTTVGALLKRWPEAKAAVAEIVPATIASVPAPMLKNLNKKLGLKETAVCP